MSNRNGTPRRQQGIDKTMQLIITLLLVLISKCASYPLIAEVEDEETKVSSHSFMVMLIASSNKEFSSLPLLLLSIYAIDTAMQCALIFR